METTKIKAGEFTFDCRIAGDPANQLVILLHGFPESSYMWIPLMEYLVEKGYYCVAPDMRGYSEGACPKGIDNYTIEKLSADVLNLAEALEVAKFHLVAHDWGSLIGWSLVYDHPDKIRSWTTLSIPHPRGFRKALKLDKVQQKKSRYIGLFLIPWLPEIAIRNKNFSKFRRLWKHCTPEALENYLSIFRRKYALTASLNYYRANFKKGRKQNVGDISSPTLFIWGNRDLAVGRVAAENNHANMKGEYTYLELEAGHWLIQTQFEVISEAVSKHISKHDS